MSTLHESHYQQATQGTAQDLRQRAHSLSDTSELSSLEIDAMVDLVAKIVPAGNVPSLILSGLARLQGSSLSQEHVRRDINRLFWGVQHMLDHVVYGAFFLGPAAVLWAYQNLLRISGKDPDAAFPEGTWQFYVDYALREDSARHTNETHGFDTVLAQNGIALSEVDRITAWVMTAIHTLYNYPDLLANEWRERTYIRVLQQISDDPEHRQRTRGLYREWQAVLPYRRRTDARGDEDYPAYRRRKFDEFLFEHINPLPEALRKRWLHDIRQAKADQLEAYQQQLSILGYLEANDFQEVRRPLALERLHVALIYRGHYYLIPAMDRERLQPADVETIRAKVASILAAPETSRATSLIPFARLQRSQWPSLRKKLPQELRKQLAMLRLSPIVINADPRDARQTLSQIRAGERGIGDNALVIFDTRESFVFDQSHIYFDGTWGVALAEIMTNEALSWASYLHTQERPVPDEERPYSPPFVVPQEVQRIVDPLSTVNPGVSVEAQGVTLDALRDLRRMFKQRSDLLTLTVNDLLLLYRAIHATTYEAPRKLRNALQALTGRRHNKDLRAAAQAALQALDEEDDSPAILLPVDGSQRLPRDRVYPMTFEVPLHELNLLGLHEQVMEALSQVERGRSAGTAFDRLQREYLGALAGFGAVMSRAKEIASAGESASVSTIKLLAHLSTPLQQFLDRIPARFDVLNDIIKGREVFSNVGAVAPSSTLRRFMTAKDDNEKKTLAWGILTDADGTMHITLRDFRPHVRLLLDAGRGDLAYEIAQDYLDTYVQGLNRYIGDLQRITRKSRETRLPPA